MSLQVCNIRKTFGSKVAVEGVSFEAASGAFGLIGTNGAGKTTTIRVILGIMRADSGQALWNGHAITRENTRFGYMPEERGVYMKARVMDQLVYFGMLRGMTRANAREAAQRLLQRLSMDEYARMPAEKLSKGNQQKVQLIATLIDDPDLVFLDEPFSGLDPINADSLRDLIFDMEKQGKTIIMSSHQMNTVEDYCSDILLLHHGKSVLSGRLADIKAGYGHTNLLCCVPGHTDDMRTTAQACGLSVLSQRSGGDEYHMDSDEMAARFLRALLEKGLYPTRYEVREPSLHEIFIEKTTAADGGDQQ